ncbi:ATP-binding protein [Rhodovibrionaceae bacterium A322]
MSKSGKTTENKENFTQRPGLNRDTPEQDMIYRELFNSSPMGLWEEDWSPIKKKIDELSAQGVKDWEGYFTGRVELLAELYDLAPLTVINQAAFDIYGVSSIAEAEHITASERLPEEELATFLQTLLAFLKERWVVELESDELNNKGKFITTRRYVTIPNGYRESWTRVLYSIEDVTARRRTEKSLRESEARYHQIFDEAPSALSVENWAPVKLKLQSLQIDNESALYAYFDQRPEELKELYDLAESLQTSSATLTLYAAKSASEYHRGSHSYEALPEELEVFQKMVVGLLNGDWRQEHESLDMKMDGTRFLVRSQLVVPLKHQSDWSRLIFSLEDVTERKQAEWAIQEAAQEAALANRSMSEFLANMSHELRTPLNAIIGFSHIINTQMLGPVGDSKYLEYAKDINDSSVHLLGIISDILDLSKLEAGKVDLVEEEVDVTAALSSCLTLVEERAREADVRLVQDLQEDLSKLKCDLQKLKQILINLLTNAIKFTEGPGLVTVRVWQSDEQGFCISVEDTGIGIRAEDIPRALAPFEQVTNVPTNLNQKGTGLGLSVTKTLVELHGGQLSIESSVGKGTAVSISFPTSRILR